jgi:energy-coupling factor transporter ATP-binding protein EcfA2
MSAKQFPGLPHVAAMLREELQKKKFVLLYAHNGTGKTRLSTEFKNLGKKVDANNETIERDTLYFNAFTEDLFSWDNDLAHDRQRVLTLNQDSVFFDGLSSLEMDVKIEEQLERYADFSFYIDYEKWFITFFRERDEENNPIPIKISRGEENIFIWCFFLAIVQLATDDDGTGPYNWVKYIYIDDPISSLDENNAVRVAHDLAHLLSNSDKQLRVAISTHHVLFYNVLANQLRKKATRYFLTRGFEPESYELENLGSVPPFHHLSTLTELSKIQGGKELNTHHFNMLRRVLEQVAGFFGYESWHECLRPKEGESEKAFQKRVIDLMSHGDYVLFESSKITEEKRLLFRAIFEDFRRNFPFNPALFVTESEQASQR